MTYKNIHTSVVHGGQPDHPIEGAVVPPIFQSSTYLYGGQQNYEDLKYIRLNNTPNHQMLHRKLALLENGEAALVTSSGMAAISATLLSLLKPGDHLLAQRGVYGGTHDFLTRDFPHFGIEFDFIDANDSRSWAAKLRPKTRAVYVESITNPLLEVGDLEGIVRFAREHHLTSLIDNTFASPVNFRPLALGFDVVLHSCTKYLNGHSDLVAGAVIGTAPLVKKVNSLLLHLGGALDPHACFLLDRGMKTLALRVECQNRNALRIARFLNRCPAVKKVHYPGLEDNASHRRAAQFFDGFGGMLSFELEGNTELAQRFIQRLRIPFEAPSLGGVESLITRPATTSHVGLSPEDRRSLGISDTLIRFSVGIEDCQDLLDDIQQALDGSAG